MPIPSTIDDLSPSSGSNSPSGSDSPTDGDNFLRAHAAFIAQLRDRSDLGPVAPEEFGAFGDGLTDDSVALVDALESGRIVDGGGRSYAVDGTVTPTSITGLRNITLIQTGDRSATDANTLDLRGLSNYFIDNVTINMGSTVSTVANDNGNNGLYAGGSQSGSGPSTTTTYAGNFWISRVRVTGSGCGTGVHVRHARDFVVDRVYVYDRVSGSTPDPTNDTQNGVQINNCTSFVLSNSVVKNLKTRLSGIDTNKWTRGFLFAEVSDCTITNCVGEECDQTFDFSGSVVTATSPSTYEGNRGFTFSNCISKSCGTWGFKFANVTHDGSISGCVAIEPGGAGFVVSTQATGIALSEDSYRTQNLDFTGCRVVNPTGTSWATGRADGFIIFGFSGHTYPRGIRFMNCSATDTRSSPLLDNAFYSDADPIESPTAGFDATSANYCINCTASNATTEFSGIGGMVCSVTDAGTQSIADSTWASIDWDTDLTDPCGLHSTGTNNNAIYIKAPGWYDVFARVVFAANGTGERQLRIIRNGGAVDRSTTTFAPSASVVCSATTSARLYLVPGDYVAVEGYQTTGGALTAQLTSSLFTVALLT